MVAPVSSSDLVASAVSWSPGNPSAGQTVTFSVTIKNQGTAASAGGAHGVTVTVLSGSGATVRTLTGSYSGTLAAGASSPAINLGTWAAVNGKYTVRTVLAADDNELPVKRANNTSEKPFLVGRGANMPYDMYEAEDGQTGGGAVVVGPNRTVGDVAGEASGRRAVTLTSTGAYVQWTTRAATNTLVARFSIPDNTTSSIAVYVNGTLNRTLPLTSKYAWLYGNETAPQNSGAGPRHIYDEANIMLTGTVAAGSVIKLQKDAGNGGSIAIDFINTEQVAPVANPDPATYVVPAGFDQQSVQAALRRGPDGQRQGRRLPAGGRLPDLEQVPGVRQGDPGRRRRPLVHEVPHPGEPDGDRRGLPGRGLGQRLAPSGTSRSSATTRSARTARARSSTWPTSRTSPSTTSGPSTRSASTGALTPTA